MYIDFVLLKGGQYYRCNICSESPDFDSLSDAVQHESTSEHVQARRRLDRPPPPLRLNVSCNLEDETHDYIPELGPSLASSSTQQTPTSVPFDSRIGEKQPEPRPSQTGTNQSDSGDWHTLMHQCSEQPEGHVTVPGPALETDPPDTVYDLFGTAAEDPCKEADTDHAKSLSQARFEGLNLPPEMPDESSPLPPEVFIKTDWENERDEPDAQFELLESSEEWWPFSNRQEALFCLMTAFPHGVFSGKELDVVRWFATKCNVPGMPPQSTLLGLESRLVESELGNYFAANSLTSLIDEEMSTHRLPRVPV
ncbi:hypothetical protein RhiJN_25229 [Ceratobasidium sp. AG-Ba]|nr:hypothetical protein RhiJN_25229 [Ceratobasidium sp. AG-Ba]